MTDIKDGSVWSWWDTSDFQVKVSLKDGEIWLTGVKGTDPLENKYKEGDTWRWENTHEHFKTCWNLVPPEISVWLNVIKWADGTTSFDLNPPYATKEIALAAYHDEPYDDYDGQPCELVATVEVKHYL